MIPQNDHLQPVVVVVDTPLSAHPRSLIINGYSRMLAATTKGIVKAPFTLECNRSIQYRSEKWNAQGLRSHGNA